MFTLDGIKGEVITKGYLYSTFFVKKGVRNNYCNCFPSFLQFQAIVGHWGQIQALNVGIATVCTTRIQGKLFRVCQENNGSHRMHSFTLDIYTSLCLISKSRHRRDKRGPKRYPRVMKKATEEPYPFSFRCFKLDLTCCSYLQQRCKENTLQKPLSHALETMQ